MVPSHRTSTHPRTLRQLVFRVLAHIVSITLLLMTRLAEVSISPTKPLSNTATEFAFELNKVFSVFGTVLDWYVTATRTDELFSFERTSSSSILLIHGSDAIFSTSEVWLLTLETHEVGVNNHRIFFRFAEVRRSLVFQLRITLL